jgi:hypothetical protein
LPVVHVKQLGCNCWFSFVNMDGCSYALLEESNKQQGFHNVMCASNFLGIYSGTNNDPSPPYCIRFYSVAMAVNY